MKLWAFYLVLLFPCMVAAQDRNQAVMDSVRKELHTQREDTTQVRLLNLMATLFKGNNDSFISYSRQELDLATQLNDKMGISFAGNNLGNGYSGIGKTQEALKYYQLSLKARLELGDKKRIGGSYCNIGNIYRDQSNFPLALENYLNAVKVLEEIGEKPFLANTYYGLGVMYVNWGNYPEALMYHNAALKIRAELGDKAGVAFSKNCICDVYDASGKIKKSLDCNLEALRYQKENGLPINSAITYMGIGRCYRQLKRYPEALENYFTALKLAEQFNMFTVVLNVNSEIAIAYMQQEKYADAETYAKKALALAQQSHDMKNIEINQATLTEIYAHTNRLKKSLESLKAYQAAKDSIVNKDNIEKVTQTRMRYEFDKKEALAKVEQEKKNAAAAIALAQQKMLRNSLIVGFVTVLLFSGVVIRNSKRQRQKNELLRVEKQRSDGLTQNLQEMLAQKDVLMKEIHHRVKNNLQVINALLELQLENITDASAIDAMTESATRVRSISLIHQHLYQDDQLTAIEMSKFTKDLFQQVSIVFKKEERTIALNSNMPERLLEIDTAVPLGLILNELMTNSYKYAFASPQVGSIAIDYKHADGLNTIHYSDSGPGLPIGFKVDQVKSLGMRVIRNLCIQLGGSFHYDASGKRFHVTYKDLVERKKEV